MPSSGVTDQVLAVAPGQSTGLIWKTVAGVGNAGNVNWINVQTDHGATGNGTTDDWAALQAAADSAAATGRPILLPSGSYDISKPWVIGLDKTATASSSQAHADELIVFFEPGARITTHSSFTTSVANPTEKPMILVLGSDTRLLYPRAAGTGTKGNGVGIRIGGGKNWRGVDNQTGALGAAITTTGQTSITVTTGTRDSFPDVEGFFIEIDGERMFVRGGAGTTTWTVIRGEAGGDAAETHSNGATITLFGFQTVYRTATYSPNVTSAGTWYPIRHQREFYF